MADRSTSVLITLRPSDIEMREASGEILQADLCNYARTVRPRTTTFSNLNEPPRAFATSTIPWVRS